MELTFFSSSFFRYLRGMLKPDEVFGLFRKLNPPVGWGKLCPEIMAYKVKEKIMFLNEKKRQLS